MYNIVDLFIKNLTPGQVQDFAIKKGANLSSQEVMTIYNFIKNNGIRVLKNPSSFNLNDYKDSFTQENFSKIQEVLNEYYEKFKYYL
jgi:hypothetical protein